MLVNRATVELNRCRFTQRKVERVHVSAAVVNRAADITIGVYDFAQLFFIEHFNLVVAITRPEFLLRFEVLHLFGIEGGEHPTVFQITLDVVSRNALTNDAIAFKRHLANQARAVRVGLFFDHINVARVTIDQLPAIAPRCAKTDFDCFEHHDF